MRCSTAQHRSFFGVMFGFLFVLLLSMAGGIAGGQEYRQIRNGYFGHADELAQVLDTDFEGENDTEPEARGTPRFDSSAALEAAARVVVQELHAASAAEPGMLSEGALASLRTLINPAAVAETFGAARRVKDRSEISPLLEFSYERIAVLHDLQSRLQRIVFAERVGVSVERYRAVALQVAMYLRAEAAAAAVVESPTVSELPETESALGVLASPELRRAMAAADQSSAEVERFRDSLELLYRELDAAVASVDLSEQGYLRPRVETLRPTMDSGRLGRSRLPFRRSVAVSAVHSEPGGGSVRRILPHDLAAELYYGSFLALTEGESGNPELWGRLHGQHVRPDPAVDLSVLSLDERFAAEMASEMRLLNEYGAEPQGHTDEEVAEDAVRAAVAVEVVDSLLRAADRYLERPMSSLAMSPELYLGREYRLIGPHSEPEFMYQVLRNALRELEQHILSEGRGIRMVAEELRDQNTDNLAEGDAP